MGGKGVRGARPPSQTAYFVALGGVVGLLLLLCCYFVYYCIRRVKQLVQQGLPERVESGKPPPPDTVAYPVQPKVRASASAMARLCHSPSRGGAPPSPRASLSPARDRFVSAQRSNSLTPARPNTLPPPNIIVPTSIRNGPKTKPGRIDCPENNQVLVLNGPVSPKKSLSPKRKDFPPRTRELSPVWKDLSNRKQLPTIRNDLPPARRRDRASSEESQQKHLSAPPRIVVGDAQ